jgi:spore maturation protein SpmA
VFLGLIKLLALQVAFVAANANEGVTNELNKMIKPLVSKVKNLKFGFIATPFWDV